MPRKFWLLLPAHSGCTICITDHTFVGSKNDIPVEEGDAEKLLNESAVFVSTRMRGGVGKAFLCFTRYIIGVAGSLAVLWLCCPVGAASHTSSRYVEPALGGFIYERSEGIKKSTMTGIGEIRPIYYLGTSLPLVRFTIAIVGLLAVLWLCCPVGAASHTSSRYVEPALGGFTYANSGVIKRSMVTAIGEVGPIHYLEGLDSPMQDGPFGRYVYMKDDGNLVSPPLGIRSAVPLGGIGAGTVELRGDGSFADWQTYNNWGEKPATDKIFFAISVKSKGIGLHTRILQTHPPAGLPGVDEIKYNGAFPVSRLVYADRTLPAEVTLEAFSSFTPHDAKNSALPAAFFSFVIKNKLKTETDVSLLFSIQNHTQGLFSSSEGEDISALTLQRQGSDVLSGSMSVGVLRNDARRTSYSAGWEGISDLWNVFSKSGELGFSMIDGRGGNGAICSKMRLRPGEKRRLTFVLTWYFPNYYNNNGIFLGHQYANWFKDSADVLEYCFKNLPVVHKKIGSWNKWCYGNDLPKWLQDVLCNTVYPLFKTTLWFKDGRFRPMESFSCPALAPVHVFFYGLPVYSLLFPELNENVINGYAQFQREDGYIQENLGGWGETEKTMGRDHFTDVCQEYILMVYQHYLVTGDNQFLDRHWPHTKKALEYSLNQCGDAGLPLRGENTYDLFFFNRFDFNTYASMIHLSAVVAMARMAVIQRESELAGTCHQTLERGRETLETYLWNGEFYRTYWSKDLPETDLCDADHLLGQLIAHVLGLGDISDRDRVRSSVEAILKYNGADTPYGATIWIHAKSRQKDTAGTAKTEGRQEYFYKKEWNQQASIFPASCFGAAAEAIYQNEVKEGLSLSKEVCDHWTLNLRDLWNWTDVYDPDDGHPTCNSHYARQMLVWAIPIALSGFQYDAPGKSLSFSPVADYMRPSSHRRSKLPFMTPSCFGFYTIEDDTITIEVLDGSLELRKLVLSASHHAKRFRVSDRITAQVQNGKVELGLGSVLRLNAGDDLRLEIVK